MQSLFRTKSLQENSNLVNNIATKKMIKQNSDQISVNKSKANH